MQKENQNSTDGFYEDIIRSIVQMSAMELHLKTLIEKIFSELQTAEVEQMVLLNQELSDLKTELAEVTDVRREDMLLLYGLFGCVGDAKQWCSVKHYAMASITAFEVYQADASALAFDQWQRKNSLFIRSLSKFLGIEVTECAACFGDIIKAEFNKRK